MTVVSSVIIKLLYLIILFKYIAAKAKILKQNKQLLFYELTWIETYVNGALRIIKN